MAKNSKYKGVTKGINYGKLNWLAQYRTSKHNWSKWCKTEKEAAMAYDIKMIQIGKEPVNILVRK